MQGPETRLRKKIVNKLQQKYPSGLFTKIHISRFSNAGIPDLLCCVQGLYVAIEIKTAKGKTTPLQDYMLKRILEAGGASGVARTPEEALKIVDDALKQYIQKIGAAW